MFGSEAKMLTLLSNRDNSYLKAKQEDKDRTYLSSHSTSSLAFLLWDRSKVPPRLLPVTEDHERMHNLLKTSGLDYVAVMPPHIAGQ